VVRRAEAIKGDNEILVAYLDDPTPGVRLVLQFSKMDKRTSLYKRLDKRKAAISAEPLKGRKLTDRVRAEMTARHLELGTEALEELLDQVGLDLRRLIGELDKLAASGLRRDATREEIAELLGKGIARPRWELSDAMGARRPERVLYLIDQLLDEGEYAPLILGTLFRSVRKTRAVRALAAVRASQGEIASRARIPPFKVREEISNARSWPEGSLERALRALQIADRRLKTGTDARVALGAAVLESCGEESRAARTRADR
jgi:DNA polymerase-3 subunit delta